MSNPFMTNGEPVDEDSDYDEEVPPNLDRDGGYWLVTGLRESKWIEPKHDYARSA